MPSMERSAMVSAQKYLALFRLAFTHSLKNYKALLGLAIFLITCLLVFAYLWDIAAAKMGGMAFRPDQLLWYSAFNQWILIAIPDMHEEIERDLQSGRLAYLLPRPLSYLSGIFAEGLGILSVQLFTLGVATFSFVWLKVGASSLGAGAFLATLAIGFLAGCVGLIFKIAIGLSAFWLRQTDPLNWIWDKMLFALGGLMLPLAAYPEWMQSIARWTPFPAILGERSALALHFTGMHAAVVAGHLLLWGLLGVCLFSLLYRRGLRLVNMEGG